MKIACISPSLIPSTTANSIQAVKACHALASLGHTVRVFTPGDGIVSWEDLSDMYELTVPFDITRVKSAPYLKRYDFIWESLRETQTWQADLVYTWLPQCAWLAGKRGIPSVLEMHDRLTGKLGPWFFNRYLNTKPKKRILIITRTLQKVLERQTDRAFDPAIVQIAPNGVDLERYENLPDAPAARSRLGLPEKFTAVYTGHFYAGRGMDLLFQLAGKMPEVSFVWVGGKPEDVSNWQKKVESAGIRNVTLTGFVPKMQLPLYQAAGNVLLMPYETAITGSSGGNSAEICSPMKMFDYLATGRVILSSELPVLHEVLHTDNAIFCPPGNVDSWSRAIQSVREDHIFAETLSVKAKQDAAQYTWQNRARQALKGMD
jgi:glycosyltransferase involved in cell wall biosynthesis